MSAAGNIKRLMKIDTLREALEWQEKPSARRVHRGRLQRQVDLAVDRDVDRRRRGRRVPARIGDAYADHERRRGRERGPRWAREMGRRK